MGLGDLNYGCALIDKRNSFYIAMRVIYLLEFARLAMLPLGYAACVLRRPWLKLFYSFLI